MLASADTLDDDSDLAASLARARRLAQKSSALAASMDDDTDVLDQGAKRLRTVLAAVQPKEVRPTSQCPQPHVRPPPLLTPTMV